MLGKKNYCFLILLLLCFCGTAIADIQKLSEADIRTIYNTYIKPNFNDEYKFRYSKLPLEKNESFWPWEGKDFPRVISILEFERFVVSNKIVPKKGLAINGIDPEWHYLAPKQLVQIDYLADPITYDLHSLNLPEKDFDFVICCQTLEHVYDPIRCLKNIYAHMNEGGILYVNVPGNSIPHDTPIHFYTGFTSAGIGAIAKMAGFKILSIGQWGNLEYLRIMHQTSDWPDYRAFKEPILNDFNCIPAIVWIFACK
jgi:SAM-dependent methyltransferase